MHHRTDRIAHTTAFVTPVVEHWLEREIAQWVHPMKDRSDDPSHHERTLLPRSYISLRHMVKDHSNSKRGNYLPPLHRLLFPITSKRSFICTTPTERITHTTAFVTPVVEYWLEREIAQWVHHEGSIRRHSASWANALTTELHLAPTYGKGPLK